jgi:glycosyltransferase involved in cell wall biosynthesis
MARSIPLPSIHVVAPGGRTATGGMCRMVDHMMTEWAAAGREPALTLVDSTGPYVKWRQPFQFAAALARVLVAGLRGRIALLHIHVAERGSVLRKAAFIHLGCALGVPCVVHMHGAGFVASYDAASPLVRRAVTHAFRKARRFVVLGSAWERYFVETVGLDRERVVVVRNAVPDPAPPPDRPASHACRLAFVGALVERKGLGELIEALADPWMFGLAWRLDVAGNGDPAPWRKRASDLGLASRITFHGWLDGAGVQRLLAASDALVLPSRAEGLPMVVIEAMAHGLPVVCTPVGTVPDAVTDGVNGLLVPPRDVEALADALARVAGDAALRRRLGRAGRERFLAEFGMSRQNDLLARIFEDAMREAQPDADAPGVAERA